MKHLEITIEDNARAFVGGDIHGCIDEFYESLHEVDFDFNKDKVFLAGDLVDRGKNSLECFNLLYKDWVYSVRGNHDDFLAQYNISEDKPNLMRVHVSNGGEWFYKLPEATRQQISEKADDMPYIITIKKGDKSYGVAHGDIPSHVKNWQDIIDGLDSTYNEMYENSLLWGRSYARKTSHHHIDPYFKIDGVDEIFLGHTVMKSPRKYGNINFIDTGLVFKDEGYGKFTLVEL
jgi:serine/threonine protein phosphatase 1